MNAPPTNVPRTNVHHAIALAKRFVQELFEGEVLQNVGLEEVEFDHESKEWVITIGFSRPWDPETLPTHPFRMIVGEDAVHTLLARTYKVVRIEDATGNAVSLKNRKADV